MWDNREFRVKIEDNVMREYEKVMLSSGECSMFMPMGFMSEDDGELVCYDCSGFAPLSSYRIERTEDALYLLERTMIILNRAVEYLITPSRITLTTDTVFYNKETGEIKIAYVPMTQEGVNLRKNIVLFIGQLKAEIRDGKGNYLREVAKYVYHHNYFFKDIINKIGLFQRELYQQQTTQQDRQGA
ncbi:MAG: DUF6382 domain-containing protein [Bacillota bacterium]|nr:DUF6382 domain-containing protein [Bacillota bacterium]